MSVSAAAPSSELTLHGEKPRFQRGYTEVAPGTWAWLQPNGVLGESNSGLVVSGDQALLIDTLWDVKLTQRMLDAQKPIIDSLAEQPNNSDLVIFSVDFDSQKPVVREFGARSQSTLIAFRGKTEMARSVGDTDPASIAALVQSTLTK